MDFASYVEEATDIHHIFPQNYCEKQKIIWNLIKLMLKQYVLMTLTLIILNVAMHYSTLLSKQQENLFLGVKNL